MAGNDWRGSTALVPVLCAIAPSVVRSSNWLFAPVPRRHYFTAIVTAGLMGLV
jgi:hypothetical protein